LFFGTSKIYSWLIGQKSTRGDKKE